MEQLKNWPIGLLAVLLLLYVGRYFYFLPKYESGERAPAFTGQLIDGTDFALAQLRGRYVLLHFWGSWCGPCRAEHPQLRALHRELAPAGLEIVSVAIERDSLRWQEAQLRDGLRWPYHLMDRTESLRFFGGPIAAAYGVKAVPTHFLIGPEGELLLVDPTLEAIRSLLAQRLAATRN